MEDQHIRNEAIEELRHSDDLLRDPLTVRYIARIIEHIRRFDTITIVIGHCDTQDSRHGVCMGRGQSARDPNHDISRNVSTQNMKAISGGFPSSLVLGSEIEEVAIVNLNPECTTLEDEFKHCRACNDVNGRGLAKLMNFLAKTLKRLKA